MANVSQLVATTYDAVVNERNKAENQWEESSFLRELARKGGIKRHSGGNQLELTLDYTRNTATDFLATDTTATSVAKTTILDAAQYTYASLVVPVNWSFQDEAKNSSENAKVDLVTSLVDNAIASHDDALERGFFATSATDGFQSLATLITENGEGTVGSINAANDTWWQNQHNEYTAASDLVATLQKTWNECTKGSGSTLMPTCLVSNAETQALYEGNLIPLQRYGDGDSANAGFKTLKFKSANYVFSPHGTDSVFMFNPKNLKLYVISSAFRQRREVQDLQAATVVNMKVFSVLQLATNNRSRIGVAYT